MKILTDPSTGFYGIYDLLDLILLACCFSYYDQLSEFELFQAKLSGGWIAAVCMYSRASAVSYTHLVYTQYKYA